MPADTLSIRKKILFNCVVIFIPIVIIAFTEIFLQIIDFNGNKSLFISMDGDMSTYKRCNPAVSQRYFRSLSTYPTPPKDIFLKEKPDNGYRIFVLGGSTTAGFPYGSNLTFPRILEKRLADTFLDMHIEVVNTAMSAINTYAFLDFIDEILSEQPDAILIYAGHNEFYGALGIGSMVSFGQIPQITRLYLKLNRFKIFQLLREIIGNVQQLIKFKKTDSNPDNASNTLMTRIVKDKVIPYNDLLYIRGKEQFAENLSIIIKKIQDSDVNVIISELVSNIGDIEPFESVESNVNPKASDIYLSAIQYESDKNFEAANSTYYLAKDLDALRFRAPEDFNHIIDSLAILYNVPIVNLKARFHEMSPNQIIGDELMIDHLHPNISGYFLIADAFYNEMMENDYITADWARKNTSDEYRKNWGYTSLDSIYADLTIKQLKAGWPFQEEGKINSFLHSYIPKNPIEEIALKYLKDPEFGLEMAHLELAELYEDMGEYNKAYNEYQALFFTIPSEIKFHIAAARQLLQLKEFSEAKQLLLKSLKIKMTYFAYKWCGQIYLRENDVGKAIQYLEKARNFKQNDSQLLFNLARAHMVSGNINTATDYYNKLSKISPDSDYTRHLEKIIDNYN